MNKVLSKPIDVQQLKNVFKKLDFEIKEHQTYLQDRSPRVNSLRSESVVVNNPII